jgi:Tat protein secretion system quality control protein TatD with DNase activity
VLDILEAEHAKKVVLHCFMGKKKLIPRIIDNGWTFSVPVVVTKLQQMQELVSMTPLAQLLTETDAPYLGPSFPAVENSKFHNLDYTTRDGLSLNTCNESANVLLSIKKIAELKGLTENEAADQVFFNYQRLF